MKQKKVWMLSGIPGSGKSYWAENFQKEHAHTSINSRDKVRFSMLSDNDQYFAKEDAVFKQFVANIKSDIANDSIENVFIDATHLNPKGRAKVLNKLDLSGCEVNCVYFTTPLPTCLTRNELRKGRSVVPASVIRRMYFSKEAPTKGEGFTHIYTVNMDGVMKEVN